MSHEQCPKPVSDLQLGARSLNDALPHKKQLGDVVVLMGKAAFSILAKELLYFAGFTHTILPNTTKNVVVPWPKRSHCEVQRL